MEKQTVYKIDSKGKTRVWSIWVDEVFPIDIEANGGTGIVIGEPRVSIEIESGLLEGKKVRESISITTGKNLGKANATTPYTQAVSEAEAKLELKLRGEYRRTLDEVSQGSLRGGIQAPMLAQKYHPTGEQNGSKTLEKMKLVGKKIHVQPKLDGNRCLIRLFSEHVSDKVGEVNYEIKGVMYTRKGDVMPVQLKHVIDQLILWYGEISTKDDDELVLDGELFSDELSFNELNGHLKRKDSQDAEALKKVKYHLYDVMFKEAPYDQRYAYIKNFGNFGDYVEVIPSYEIIATDKNIKAKLEEFLAEGHEGLMIRTLDKGYENKRSWQLVKVKMFEDEEFEVIDVFLDKRSNTGVIDNDGTYNTEPVELTSPILGGFVMKLKEPTKDRDGKEITTFKAGVSGMTREEQAKVIENKDQYIGKQGTVEFFGKSEYDIPRFPKFKAIREEKI